MINTNKYRILVGIIVILVATNLSIVGSFYYHRMSEGKATEVKSDDQKAIPGEQRTRFFTDQLNLTDNQIDQFREINRTFNRTARGIEMNLTSLRKEMIDELGQASSDTVKLNRIAEDIGTNHRRLKQVTVTFYLDMKKICTPGQQTKLHEIFQSMLNKENQVNLPQPGYQRGRGRNR